MNKLGFLFLAVLYILISILSFDGNIPENVQIICCGTLIALVGIPHGAIDHVLYSSVSSKSMVSFYTIYLALMVAYVALWFLFPVCAMLFFLLISAYHFGESQLSYIQQSKLFSVLQYSVWGIHLLSTYIFYQLDTLAGIFNDYALMKQFVDLFKIIEFQGLSVVISGSLLAIYFAYLLLQRSITVQQVLQEIYVLVLIHISFYLFGPLVSFTLYFVILHSMKVMLDEFQFLKEKFSGLSFYKFIKLLIPFSVVSFLGLFLIILFNNWILDLPIIYLIILMTSVITLPHAIVMHLFYAQAPIE